MSKRTVSVGLSALALAGVFSFAVAQPDSAMGYYRDFRARMSKGYSDYMQPTSGSMNEGQTRRFTLNMNPGSFRAIGACDIDCNDMDFTLYDPSGRQIAEDMLTDSFPLVDFNVARSGRYTLEVSMYDCDIDPCSYVVGVLRRS